MIVTSKSFILYLQSLEHKHPQIRLGQHMFNQLYDISPKLADSVRGGTIDPFHNDNVIPSFLLHVIKQWNVYIDH
jgi:pectate lyase